MTSVLAHLGPGPFAVHAVVVTGLAWFAVRGARGNRVRAAATVVGAVALLVALSPHMEDVAGTSFAAHMGQHLLLIAVAAPALGGVRAHELVAVGIGDLSGRRHRGARLLSRAPRPSTVALATTISVAAVLLWHLPAAWEGALRFDALHVVEHFTLLAASYWFWSLVLDPRLSAAVALPALLMIAVPQGFLASVLTFSSEVVYAGQADGMADPLVDQQLAGLLMWVPAGSVNLGAAALVVVRSLERSKRRSDRRDVASAVLAAGRSGATP